MSKTIAIFATQPQPNIGMVQEISFLKVKKIRKRTEQITLIFGNEEEREKMKKMANELDLGMESVVSFVDYKMKPSDEQYVIKESFIPSFQKNFLSAISGSFSNMSLGMA